MRKSLPVLAFLIVAGWGMSSASAAVIPGFTGTAPSISCERITIDPPFYFVVHFSGTDNGTPLAQTVRYGSETPHLAVWHHQFSPGTHHVVLGAEMRGAHSLTADVTFTCATTASERAASSSSAGSTPSLLSLPFTGGNAGQATLVGVGLVGIGDIARRFRRRAR